ncbi:hypothetical protein M3914_003443 [Vibrio metschnikovii]|nr:hypothetical protein [Vibrio metschnikovii]EKO3612225.1 hypothetical protein [Vibrio metschnikovii]EKO3684966.1 hypothetical protein [Vibrio metschnikovii]EKO3715655.1 hypothetical protein [Vibrio metschnikovii]EKO3740288.1 hypothetical protein [Vibrio metschnikovii]
MSYKITRKKLGDREILWRYMDLPKFLSLLSNESIWLARSDTFRDKREGVFHSAMRLELDKIYADLESKGEIPSDAEIKNTSVYQRYLSDNTYISCWHKNSAENMVMWELYGQSENSIAIKTTVDRLEGSFNLNNVYKIALMFALDEVEYIDHDSAPSERNGRQPFFLKRPHFSFEQEARLYLFARERKTRGEAPSGYNIKLDIQKLIESVYVHPDSEEWFYMSIKDLVAKYNLNVPVERGLVGNKF